MDYSIGELAKRTGVKVPTIRYYEQIRLLPPPVRTEGQQRRYDKQGMSRLAFIKHARELGFDVEAIRTLLSLQDNPNKSCSAADRIASARLADVESRINSLNSLRQELQRMLAECASGRVAECRVIETLSDESHQHARLD